MDPFEDDTPFSFLNSENLCKGSTDILEKAGLVLEKAGVTITPTLTSTAAKDFKTFSKDERVTVCNLYALSSSNPAPNVVNTKQSLPIVTSNEFLPLSKCSSESRVCISLPLKGFKYCQHHLFEDVKKSLHKSPVDSKQNVQSRFTLDSTSKSFINTHKIGKDSSLKNKNKKMKKKPQLPMESINSSTKRPSTLAVSQDMMPAKKIAESSSEDEEFNFYTDTVQVKKTECMWLGNQASDADSTDSEDENSLNNAGIWTFEEALKTYKQKMMRLRSLYAQQFKRMNSYLKEEKRKMVNDFDMDPFVLSKVQFHKHTDDAYCDYMEDVYITNYQRASFEGRVAEKMMKEKRSKGITPHTRRPDLPKCQHNVDGSRCSYKVLPFSKFCSSHILSDADQYLFSPCSSESEKCSKPHDILDETCRFHIRLNKKAYDKQWNQFISSRKRRLYKKQRNEDEKEKNMMRATRTSSRIRQDPKRKRVEITQNEEPIIDQGAQNPLKSPQQSKNLLDTPNSFNDTVSTTESENVDIGISGDINNVDVETVLEPSQDESLNETSCPNVLKQHEVSHIPSDIVIKNTVKDILITDEVDSTDVNVDIIDNEYASSVVSRILETTSAT